MFRLIIKTAHRLDHALQERLGRPYRAILSVGLIIEIVRRISELPAEVHLSRGLIEVVLVVLMNLALLINQLGEMSQRMDARAARRAAKDQAAD